MDSPVGPVNMPDRGVGLKWRQCVLRVNGSIRAMVEDLSAADHSLLHGVMVPKCEDAHPLRNAADLTDGAIGLIALVESPAGLQRLAKSLWFLNWWR